MAAAAPEIHPNSPAAADIEVLREAGSDPSLLLLPVVNNDAAPIELLAEFIRCVMDEEYHAARVLCKRVLEFEPSNETAQQFLPVIEERLQLDDELETESSSSSSEASSEDSDSDDVSDSQSDDVSNSHSDKADDVTEHSQNNCYHSNCTS